MGRHKKQIERTAVVENETEEEYDAALSEFLKSAENGELEEELENMMDPIDVVAQEPENVYESPLQALRRKAKANIPLPRVDG